jgi:predicted RNA-binding protein Jag
MNNELNDTLKKLIELMGFEDFSVNFEPETRRVCIFINEGEALNRFLPQFVNGLDCVVRAMTQKDGAGAGVFFIDVNNYRRERENLIVELARAAARKSAAEKREVSLPPMNAYERRLIHLELSQRPDLKTESVGEGKERYVTIKPL